MGTRTRCTSQPIQQAQKQCPNKCPIFLDLSINFFQKLQPPPTNVTKVAVVFCAVHTSDVVPGGNVGCMLWRPLVLQ